MKRAIAIGLRAIDLFEDAAMIVFMAVATTLTFVQVIFRYVLNNSIYWTEEVVLYSIIAMSFVGASMGVRKGAHISLDLLGTVAGPGARVWLVRIAAVLGAMFGLVLLYFGGQLFLSTLARGQLSPALRIPVALAYAPIPLSGILLVIRYATLFAQAGALGQQANLIDEETLA